MTKVEIEAKIKELVKKYGERKRTEVTDMVKFAHEQNKAWGCGDFNYDAYVADLAAIGGWHLVNN